MIVAPPTVGAAIAHAQSELGRALLTFDVFESRTGVKILAFNQLDLAHLPVARLCRSIDRALSAPGAFAGAEDFFLIGTDEGERIVAVLDLAPSVTGLMVFDGHCVNVPNLICDVILACISICRGER